ncbi:MAG: tetratricopeptide repeat protein [Sulfitobacter sp.]
MFLTFSLPAMGESVSGAYLAGRHAAVNSDFAQAAKYYASALTRDPQNVELMESAALSYLSLGEVAKSVPLGQMIEAAGSRSQAAHMAVIAGLIDAQDYKALVARDAETQGIGPWVDGLIKAWAYLGDGDLAGSMAEFDRLRDEPGMQSFVGYHKALARASLGDYEGANEIFSADDAGSVVRTRRGVMAHAEILSQLGRNADAIALIEENFAGATDPEIDTLLGGLAGDDAVPFTHMPNVQAGMAEVFYTFAAVLKNENAGDHYTLLFSRLAQYLRPDHVDALLLTADLLEGLDQHSLSSAEFKKVPASSPAYHAAELGRAGALRRAGEPEKAIEVLETLARSHGDLAVVHSTLGDILRSEERFEEAIKAYDRALEQTSEDTRARWLLYYARAIAEERTGDWEASERDFRAALEIEPEQPQVLNYLGYSLVEQRQKLDEALNMIERAVAGSPDSGYIVDSLGWVLYRLGRYDEAVAHMERAVELIPVDPVVNDHLGDVYWAVGRAREARFQWSRALSFIDPEDTDGEADPVRIRRKLDVGLDAVLEEEGAEPLKVARD